MDLSYEDRQMLRAIVRKHHAFYFADHPTDAQCDQLIEALGPVVHEKLLRAFVDQKFR